MKSDRLTPGLVLACLFALHSNTAEAQKKAPGGKAVLLLSGGQREHHGYRDQANALAASIEETKKYQVTIVEDASILESPALAKYDVIIGLTDRRDDEFKYTVAQQKALIAHVKNGHGYISLHGADNAAKDWVDDWRDMLGGVFSHVGLPDSKTKKGSFHVKVAQPDHPIVKGIADFDIKDELYYNLQMRHEIAPLATTEHAGATWPIAWTREYGRGRVFHTVFGHRDFGPGKDDPLRNPGLNRMVLQGLDWVASKP